jgi:hypothetical protein
MGRIFKGPVPLFQVFLSLILFHPLCLSHLSISLKMSFSDRRALTFGRSASGSPGAGSSRGGSPPTSAPSGMMAPVVRDTPSRAAAYMYRLNVQLGLIIPTDGRSSARPSAVQHHVGTSATWVLLDLSSAAVWELFDGFILQHTVRSC